MENEVRSYRSTVLLGLAVISSIDVAICAIPTDYLPMSRIRGIYESSIEKILSKTDQIDDGSGGYTRLTSFLEKLEADSSRKRVWNSAQATVTSRLCKLASWSRATCEDGTSIIENIFEDF